MPLYDYQCPNCNHKDDFITKADDNQICPFCNFVMKRLISFTHGVNMGAAGAYGYYDDNLQTYIHTNKQRREEMKKQGVNEGYGKGWY